MQKPCYPEPKTQVTKDRTEVVSVPKALSRSHTPVGLSLNRWLSGLGIRQKIGYGYALAIGIAVLGTSSGLIIGEYYRQQAIEQLAQVEEEEYVLESLKIAVLESQSDISKLIYLLRSPQQFDKKQLEVEYSDLQKHLDKTKNLFLKVHSSASSDNFFRYSAEETPELKQWLQSYASTIQAYSQELEILLQEIKPSDLQPNARLAASETLLKFSSTKAALEFDALKDNLSKLNEIASQQEEQAKIAFNRADKLRSQIIGVSMLLSIASATALAMYTSRAIARPLEAATKFARLVTEKANFKLQADVTTQDEVGQLVTTLNQMIQHVASYTQELEKRQAQYQALLNAIPDLMLQISKDGIYLDFKPPKDFQPLVVEGEVIGSSVSEILPPDIAKQHLHYIKQALSTGQPQVFEYQLIIDGNIRDQEARIVVVSGKNEVLAIVRDITQRKQAERSLRRLAAIVEATPDIVGTTDRHGNPLYLNQAGHQLLGISIDEDISTKVIAKYHPDWARKIVLEQGISTAIRKGTWSGETAVLAPDGQEIPVLQVLIAHKAADGSVEYLSTIARDISDRVVAEQLLQRHNSVLKAQQEAALDGILVVDENRKIASRNTRFVEMWQIPEEVINCGDDDKLLDWVLSQLEQPQEFLGKVQYLYAHLHEVSQDEIYLKDGRIFDRYSSPVLSPEGDYYGRIWCFRDITQRKQAEVALQQQTQQLEQTLWTLQQTQAQLIQSEKMSSLGQMVAGLAHEINNPVNFIYGNIQYANDYIQDLLELVKLYQQQYPEPTSAIQAQAEDIDLEFLTADLPKMISSMRTGAERIRSLVLSLRNFARLDEGELKTVNLHEGIENTLLILSHRLKKGITINKDYGDLPPVECYPAQLNQVFMNLFSNAIDALLERGEELNKQIIIQTEAVTPTQIQVRIRDNGPGIPAKIKDKIFDPFFTTKPVGKGMGLGLAICYQVIKKHHGQITMHSQSGEGCEFTIALPVKQVVSLLV